MRAVVAIMLLALAGAAGADAHRGGSHAGFASRVSVIDPFFPGLLVTVLGGHRRLSITNLTGKTIVILDARRRPLVRITAGQTKVWTEPRIGANDDPPEKEGLVRYWRIPGTAGGMPFEIVGFLGYRPPPGEADEAAAPLWAVIAAAALAALVVAALVLQRRRVRA
jgi:hypothetical protein